MIRFLSRNAQEIAYRLEAPDARHENAPYIVYLGGLSSSMDGTKASWLALWAKHKGAGFLRFDYSGHGSSDGRFIDFGLQDWIDDARFLIEKLIPGPVILVGSSLGGWVAAALVGLMKKRIIGFLGLAAAPDFVERDFLPRLSVSQLAELERGEVVALASDYPQPYLISKKFLDQGLASSVMKSKIIMNFPVILLQGLSDQTVQSGTALDFGHHIESPNLEIIFLKGEDHGLSTPETLKKIGRILENWLEF